jgi:hypothetical protein
MLQDFLRPARGARAFRMADEQRQYRWTVALAEQLFNDYAALTPRVDDASTPPFHYLNAFHVAVDETAEAETSVTVFDGQQRLTTTMLILLAVWQGLLPFRDQIAAITCRDVLNRLATCSTQAMTKKFFWICAAAAIFMLVNTKLCLPSCERYAADATTWFRRISPTSAVCFVMFETWLHSSTPSKGTAKE